MKLTFRQSCAIPKPLPFKDVPPKLETRRRVTLTMTDSHQHAIFAPATALFGLIAILHNSNMIYKRKAYSRAYHQPCSTT